MPASSSLSVIQFPSRGSTFLLGLGPCLLLLLDRLILVGNLDVHVAESVVLVGLLLLSLLDVHLHVHVGGHVLVLGQEGGAVGGLLVCSS